nr:CD109 antigen-like protein [Arenicola marina]
MEPDEPMERGEIEPRPPGGGPAPPIGRPGMPGPTGTPGPQGLSSQEEEEPAVPQVTNGTYAAVMPKVLRPGRPFDVNINLLMPTTPSSDVTVEMHLRDMAGDSVASASYVITEGVRTGTIRIEAPDMLDEATYNVTFMGSSADGSFSFHNDTEVEVKRKTMSIFVQTDKAIYKPSQTVKFRALAVYPDLLPYVGPMNISIYDKQGNKLKQWLNQENAENNGVVGKELPLSEQPPLGDWLIKVSINEMEITKTFAVEEYVLPKYEVTVDLPSFILSSTENVKGKVTAKYTYGQPVRGTALIRLSMEPYSWEVRGGNATIEPELVDGKAEFEVPMSVLTALVPSSRYQWANTDPLRTMIHREFLFEVNVTETLTDKVMSKNATLPVKPQKYNVEIMDITPESYKPGLAYTGYIQVAQADGTPPVPSDLMYPNGTALPCIITINMQQPRNYSPPYESYGLYMPAKTIVQMQTVPPSGLFSFSFVIDDEATGVDYNVRFRDFSVYRYIQKFKSRDEAGIQVSLMNSQGTIQVGELLTLGLKATQPTEHVFIELLSKGVMVQADMVSSENGPSQEHSYMVQMTSDLAQLLAPNGRVVVWYVTENGEVISDSLDFTVEGAFSNDVSLSFSTNETRPGTSVSLTVNAHRNSYVGVLAVDQSVLLLKGGNDITQDQVLEDLRSYDSNGQHDMYYPMARGGMIDKRRKRCLCSWWPRYNGGMDSMEVFENAGVIVMTDAHLYQDPPPNYHYYDYNDGGIMEGAPGMGGGMEEDEAAMAPMPPANAGDRAPQAGAPGPGGDGDENKATGGGGLQAVGRIRTAFPETWLWSDARAGEDGTVTIDTTAPDTITSWVASAFAVSTDKGLGVADMTSKLTVFKPFFITLNLPYSVIRGEEFGLQALVFNYLHEELEVLVTLEMSDEFKVKQPNAVEAVFAEVKATIRVPPGDGKSVKFWIVPQNLGNIAIQIKAQSTVAADGLKRMLLVEPEGMPQEYTSNVFIDLSESDGSATFTKWVETTRPDDLVPGSARITAMAIGDVMGPSISGLDNLIRMPYGCGEQNMLNFAPNIFIMQYLTATGQLNEELRTKATTYMEKGYQRELTYQHRDGSFSAFGDRDPSGSLWLTAFVVKSFYQARDWISPEPSKMIQAVEWMIENQAADGHMAEPPNGRVIHTEMQGGSSKGVSLTAYALITMLELREMPGLDYSGLEAGISKAVMYLEEMLADVATESYTLSIVSYALALAESDSTTTAVDYLNNLAIQKDGEMHWTKTGQDDEDHEDGDWRVWRPPTRQAKSTDIEMTSYALMTYTRLGMVSDGIPVMKWLVAQRNALGGFASTQDTVMALQALAAYATHVSAPGSLELDVQLLIGAQTYNFERLSHVNAVVLQMKQLPVEGTDFVRVFATGKGFGMVQINVRYNVMEVPEPPAMNLDVSSDAVDGKVKVTTCGWWTADESSGMVVFTVRPLTGYQLTNMEEQKGRVKGLKRVEETDEHAVFYLDELTGERLCLELEYEKTLEVANLQQARVEATSYYKPDQKKTNFYLPAMLQSQTMCDACADCCDDSGGAGDMEYIEGQPGSDPTGGWVPPGDGSQRPPINRPSEYGRGGGATCLSATTLAVLLLSAVAMVLKR